MLSEDTLASRVLAIAAGIAGSDRTPPGAGPETPLGEGGFRLDSVGLLELIVACEEAFGVVFDPELDLTVETLSTVRSLAELIRVKSEVPPRPLEKA